MKRTGFCFTLVYLVLTCFFANAEEKDTLQHSKWHHGLDINFYILSDDFFVIPVYRADKDWLHLEARYNYEDFNTFSAWFGYNFTGGNKFQYMITPMVGALAGNTNGFAPGLEADLNFIGFEFYTESEFVIDINTREGDYFYTWTSFSYSPLEWLWFGVSVQRTKLYETKFDIQRGLMLGGGYRWISLTGYVFNLGSDDLYGIITLSANIPE